MNEHPSHDDHTPSDMLPPALQRSDAHPMPYYLMMSRIKKFFIYSLPMLLLAELFVHKHAYFSLDKSMFFHAWYGLIGCIIIVACSKALGLVLKRSPFYYDPS